MTRREKHLRKYIPQGIYCYEGLNNCRFYQVVKRGESWQEDICRCNYLRYTTSFDKDGTAGLLFLDECKICGIKDDRDDEDYPYKRHYRYKYHRWKDKQNLKKIEEGA